MFMVCKQRQDSTGRSIKAHKLYLAHLNLRPLHVVDIALPDMPRAINIWLAFHRGERIMVTNSTKTVIPNISGHQVALLFWNV